jgi:hypothetical protein
MSRKKLIWAAAVIVAVGIGAWLWLGYSETEADDERSNIASAVRTAWQQSQQAFERL